MEPVTPVVKGLEEHEVVYAKNQPQYMPLPTIQGHGGEGRLLTRWRLSDEEREQVARGADLYLEILTFNHYLQPVLLYFGGEPDQTYVNQIKEKFHLDEKRSVAKISAEKRQVPLPPPGTRFK